MPPCNEDLGCRLPMEVLNHIFVTLRESDDILTLRSCSLVASSFKELCQQQLFNTLELVSSFVLDDDPVTNRPSAQGPILKAPDLSRLSDAMDANSNLALYVRTLHLQLEFSWLGDPLLPNILRRLSNVRVFSLRSDLYRPNGDPSFDWANLDVELRQALEGIMGAPTLEELAIFYHSRGIPLQSLLYAATGLQDLGLHTVRDPVPMPASQTNHTGLTHLRQLEINSGAYHAFADPRHFNVSLVPGLHNLKSLTLEVNQGDDYRSLLRALGAANGLEDIFLDVIQADDVSGLISILASQSLKTLKAIKIRITATNKSLLNDLIIEILSIPAANIIENLTIEIYMFGRWELAEAAWSPLDSLSSSKTFRCLEHVFVKVLPEDFKEQGINIVKEACAKLMTEKLRAVRERLGDNFSFTILNPRDF